MKASEILPAITPLALMFAAGLNAAFAIAYALEGNSVLYGFVFMAIISAWVSWKTQSIYANDLRK